MFSSKSDICEYLNEHLQMIESLKDDMIYRANVDGIANVLTKAILNKKKIITFGNGGSASDAQHFTAELVVRFRQNRIPFPAICLNTDTSVLTAISNDFGYEFSFSRYLDAIVEKGDVVCGFSTSGNSENVVNALELAKNRNITTVGFLGACCGKCHSLCDFIFYIDSNKTSIIQEFHLLTYHILSDLIEKKVIHETKGTQ